MVIFLGQSGSHVKAMLLTTTFSSGLVSFFALFFCVGGSVYLFITSSKRAFVFTLASLSPRKKNQFLEGIVHPFFILFNIISLTKWSVGLLRWYPRLTVLAANTTCCILAYDYGMHKNFFFAKIAVHDISVSKIWNLCINNRK